ncbi:peptide ABC transporter substrate-binding protein [Inquilinus sp. Marseille-Q2685]|uniref:peptide ABC transporter substrate-binding protein n=1 Tax=Inquilinus sp. Marseille-Q2685 TaxID=2866581 RepID=UPI001CE46C83|nr:peptide ABC transporter substrate-binding protein [Inquilinus sp. Marseille-Q2685]
MHSFTKILARGLLAAVLLGGVSSAALAEMVLNRGNGSEPETLDVHKSSGVPESFIQMDLYEGLLMADAKGEPVPGQAESWTVSDDGLTYTFKLRQNAKWSDGTPVTADDWVFSMRRLIDPKTASDYGYFLDQVVNARDIRLGQNGKTLEDLGVKAIDDHTLEVKLVAPTPYFLSSLLHHSTHPISKANYEKFGDDFVKPGNMVSNGAYMLAEAVPQGYVKVVKNPHYWDAANVKIDTVMFYPTEDIDAELQRFKAGELDMTYELPSQQIPTLKKEIPDQIHITPYFGTYFYAFNMTKEPWKSNADLRRALYLAIDRDTLIKHVTQADQLPAYSFVPPGTDNYPGFEPDVAKMTQAERDAQAKELFAKAGYGPDKPLKLEITYNTSENHKKVAVAIAAMWKKTLGVDVTLQNQEWGTFQETRDKKQFPDIARHGWIGDYNDANNFLELETAYIGEQNTSGYDNPKYDELMKKAGLETDLAKRGELMVEAEKMMIQDLPIIPIYFYTTKHAVSPAVKGWQDNVQDYHLSRWLSVER